MDLDELKVKFYDELNISYGDESEKEIIAQEITDELSDILSPEELQLAIINETQDIISNKDIRVRLLDDYRKWGPDCFKRGAVGVVREWKFFRYRSYTWNYAYVLVEIDGEECPVNIEKLEVLDENFLEAEKRFFRKFKSTYKYVPTDNLLILNDEIQLHCTALIDRILGYLE